MPDNGLSEADEKEMRESVNAYLDQVLMPASKEVISTHRATAKSSSLDGHTLCRRNGKWYLMDTDGEIRYMCDDSPDLYPGDSLDSLLADEDEEEREDDA